MGEASDCGGQGGGRGGLGGLGTTDRPDCPDLEDSRAVRKLQDRMVADEAEYQDLVGYNLVRPLAEAAS